MFLRIGDAHWLEMFAALKDFGKRMDDIGEKNAAVKLDAFCKQFRDQPVLDQARLKQFHQLVKNSPLLPVEPMLVRAVADLAQNDMKTLLAPFKSDPKALTSLIKYLVRAFESSVAPSCTVYKHTIPHAPQGMLQALLHPIVLWLTPLDQSPSDPPLVEPAGPPVPHCPSCSKTMEATDTQNHEYTYVSYSCNGCGAGGSGVRWVCAACKNDYCFTCKPHTAQAAAVGTLELLLDPLLPMAELEAQLLRRCAVPPGSYTEHCRQLVGHWIELPDGGSGRSVALVVGCRQLEGGGPMVHCLAYPADNAVPLPWQLTNDQLSAEWLTLPEAASSRLEERILAALKYHVLVNPPESAALDMAATTRLRRALWAAAYAGVSDLAQALTAAISVMKHAGEPCSISDDAADLGSAVLLQCLGATAITGLEHTYRGPTDTQLLHHIEQLLEHGECAPKPAAAAAAEVAKPAAEASPYRW